VKMSRARGMVSYRRMAVLAPTLTALLALAGAGTARAHQDRPGCSGTGVAITFEVFRADGTTSVDLSQTVSECELITYQVTLAASSEGNPCAFDGGTITITTPQGCSTNADCAGPPAGTCVSGKCNFDVTPSGGVPCIGGTVAGGCGATSATSNAVTYRVSPADFDVNGDVKASATYTAAGAHTHMMFDEVGVPTAHTAVTNVVETCAADTQCVVNFCDPALTDGVRTGACSHTNLDGHSCDDGNLCTTGDTCSGGTCAGTPVTCTASDQCHKAGTCDPSTGDCSNPTQDDGFACSDGNACTSPDTCQAGVCTPGATKTCTPSDQCHKAGTCDPGTGVCSNPTQDDGFGCSDGNTCTSPDTCQAAECTPGATKTCTPSDQCHKAGTCDPGTGVCSNPTQDDFFFNDTATTEIYPLSLHERSSDLGATKTCTPSDQCHKAGTCDPGTGVCSNPTQDDGFG